MNSLSAFMMNTLGSATAQRVTDDTQAYSLQATLDNNVYYFTSFLCQHPTNKDIILHVFTQGDDHGEDPAKKIIYRKSTDRGETFGSINTLYDPTDSTFQIQGPGCGYDSNGRFHIFADCHSDLDAPGGTHEIRHMYSDDDGATVSSATVIPFPSTSMLTFQIYDKLVQMGSNIMISFFFYPEQDVTTSTENWLLRSEDFGATWDWVFMGSVSGNFRSEGSGLAVTPTVGIWVFRSESPARFFMYKTLDAGLTFIECGEFGFLIMPAAGPCRLNKFKADNGVDLVEMVFLDRGNTPKKISAVYGRADVAVTAGTGLWKQTIYTIHSDATYVLNYGDVCHNYGNLNAIGMYEREVNFPTDNELLFFKCPATHYGSVLLEVLPVSIYDSLALPQFIFDWRGLIVNNVNDSGTVNSSNQVTVLKGLYPGLVGAGYNFTATAGGIILGDGVEFDGTKPITGTTPLNFNFLSHSSSGSTDINYTIYFVIKPGVSSNPDAVYGFFGTAAGSAGNIGINMIFDDRSSQSRSNAFRLYISKGSAGFTFDFLNDNMLTPNVYQVVCCEVDLSQATQNNRAKLWVNDVLQSTTVTTSITTINAPPTYNPQIGALGNNIFPFVGGIKQIIFQNAIDIPSVRTYMTQILMTINGI